MSRQNVLMAVGITVLTAWGGICANAQPPMPPEGQKGGPGGPFMASIKSYDTNQDGTISQEEFTAGWNKENKERFARLDTDGNNMLSKEEVAKEQRRGPGGPKRQGMGANNGADGSDRPPMPPEGDRHSGARPPMPPSPEVLDANGDGSVSQEEFSTTWNAFGALQFKFMDTNGDGQLTGDEVNKRQGPPPPPPVDGSESGMGRQR